MAVGPTGAWQRELGNLFDAGCMAGLSDRDLMDRFAGPRDQVAEAAFEALVSRHGPMVYRVCRNLLPNPDDVEDAFQATFLVLVKHQASIRKLDSVASWLYGVAARVAARARVDAARRRKAEDRGIRLVAESISATDTGDEFEGAANGAVIQEEVRLLPDKYRSVVVLCFWEGLTQEQTALRLGCPIGTVRSRMARARDLLRRRLGRRGLALTSGAVALLLEPVSSPAAISASAVPQSLIVSSVLAATRVAAGRAIAEVVSANVASMVRIVTWSIMMAKLRNLALPLAATLVLAGGATLWAQQSRGKRPENPPRSTLGSARTEPQRPAAKGRSEYASVIEPPDLLLVEVLEALPGRPISGERLVRPDGTISLGFYGDVEVAGLTIPEAKEKIVLHMRKYLTDEVLGLKEDDPETGEPRKDVTVAPKDTDRVFVDITAYNSRNSYVEGEVASPGRFPFTGSDRVLDIIHYAGGILPWADSGKIRLIRSFPKGSAVQTLPIDYDEITMGIDQSTNYEIKPGDRLVVPRDPKISRPLASTPQGLPSETGSETSRHSPQLYFNRKWDDNSNSRFESQRKLERRLDEMERKLDAILSRLGDRRPR